MGHCYNVLALAALLALTSCDDSPVVDHHVDADQNSAVSRTAINDAGDDPTKAGDVPVVVVPRTPEFNPEHTRVLVYDDGSLEILAFDKPGELVGVLLMDASSERLHIDASFGDGYVEGVLASASAPFDPPPGMISSNQLLRLCGALGDNDNDIDPEITMWWGTDFADPCAATTRLATIFDLSMSGLADAEAAPRIARSDDQAGPTRRQCIARFATAGALCGFTALFPYTAIAAVACLKGVFDTWCDCNAYLPVKVC
ncbi:MAG: hypothetical protein R6X02_17325 [Enhygromyxa sp.]